MQLNNALMQINNHAIMQIKNNNAIIQIENNNAIMQFKNGINAFLNCSF